MPGAPRSAMRLPCRARLPITLPWVDLRLAPLATDTVLPAPATTVPVRLRVLLSVKAPPAVPLASITPPAGTLTVAPMKRAPGKVLRVPATMTVPPRAVSRVKAWPAAIVAVPA